MNNKLVRQALSHAFPYQQFIQDVMLGQATQSYGPVPAGMWGHSEDLLQYTNDLDKARELLDEAGYPQGGFDLLMTYNVGDLDQKQVGEMWSLSTNCGGSRKVWGKTKLFSRKLR